MLNNIQKEEVGESFTYFSDEKSSNSSAGTSSSSWWSSSLPRKEEVGESFSYEEPVVKEKVGESFSYEESSQKQEDANFYSSSTNYTKPNTYTHIPSHTHSTHYVYSHNTVPQYSTHYPYHRVEPRPVSLGGVIFAGALFCLGVLAITIIFSSNSKNNPNPPPRSGNNPPPPVPTQHTVYKFNKPVEGNCQTIKDLTLNCPTARRVAGGVTEIFGKVCKLFKYPAQGSTPCQIKEENCKCEWRKV